MKIFLFFDREFYADQKCYGCLFSELFKKICNDINLSLSHIGAPHLVSTSYSLILEFNLFKFKFNFNFNIIILLQYLKKYIFLKFSFIFF